MSKNRIFQALILVHFALFVPTLTTPEAANANSPETYTITTEPGWQNLSAPAVRDNSRSPGVGPA